MTKQTTLFSKKKSIQDESIENQAWSQQTDVPLALRMRPQTLDDIVGQEHLVGPKQLFRQAVESGTFGSSIFWGPPGSGKTTLANVIANATDRKFVTFHASFNGVKDIKRIVELAKYRIEDGEKNTILFIDEIHRFNKAQQDAFLQPVEQGTILLLGATTENPSFEINSALLSRCSVYVLKQLEQTHLETIIARALILPTMIAKGVRLEDDAKQLLVNYANGDARAALNVLEMAAKTTPYDTRKKTKQRCITKEIITQVMSSRRVSYDKKGEEFYNLISALHKSMRGSDPQASLYWLARMIEGGADPLYIARRLVRFASEDIGLADPQALVQAMAAKEAVHFVGFPEGDTALAQAVVYLATAPKSNKLYEAIGLAKRDVRLQPNEPVPLHIRNAPTKLMKDLEYGKDYQYDHDQENNFSGQSFLPDALKNKMYYRPGGYGFEREIKKRLDYWYKLRKQKK